MRNISSNIVPTPRPTPLHHTTAVGKLIKAEKKMASWLARPSSASRLLDQWFLLSSVADLPRGGRSATPDYGVRLFMAAADEIAFRSKRSRELGDRPLPARRQPYRACVPRSPCARFNYTNVCLWALLSHLDGYLQCRRTVPYSL